ncbi:MAG: DUF4438 domain-containing protein [Eubacteriaceae bacterium]|jgi:hypothetical protein|nr:DUF4438 domain-containing protein [Eubacteriaceae bacterium]
MLKTNRDKLVIQSVMGEIAHPPRSGAYRVNNQGQPLVLPGVGGIVYNVKIGDSAFGWEGDHIEPGVSIKNTEAKYNEALNTISCVGNEAKVVSGDASGAIGYVSGTHGGIEHVMVQFQDKDLEKMVIGDKIQIKACGQGLKFLDYPEVKCLNLSDELLEKWEITEKDGALHVPVCATVPAYLMGSGVGSSSMHSGDYDIMTSDDAAMEEFGIGKLRLGDLVMIIDHDTRYGVAYRKGYVSVGVIVHSDCIQSGHGPGVCMLLTGKAEHIKPVIDDGANIGTLLLKK